MVRHTWKDWQHIDQIWVKLSPHNYWAKLNKIFSVQLLSQNCTRYIFQHVYKTCADVKCTKNSNGTRSGYEMQNTIAQALYWLYSKLIWCHFTLMIISLNRVYPAADANFEEQGWKGRIELIVWHTVRDTFHTDSRHFFILPHDNVEKWYNLAFSVCYHKCK